MRTKKFAPTVIETGGTIFREAGWDQGEEGDEDWGGEFHYVLLSPCIDDIESVDYGWWMIL